MRNILSKLSLKNLSGNIVTIIKRFPILVILIIALCSLEFFLLHRSDNMEFVKIDIISKIMVSIVITFFLSLGFYLASESFKMKNLRKYTLQIVSLGLGTLFYFGLKKGVEDIDNVIFIILNFILVISYLYFSPYLKQIIQRINFQNKYYSYFFTISTVFLISAIFGGVLFMLGNVGIFSVIALFDLKEIITGKIFGDWAIIALSFVTPLFALTKVPDYDSFTGDNFNENKFFSFLIKYIGIPFICIYFIILYAYSIKVLINFQQWPKGEVSWLVIGFSTFGYIIYMFSYAFEQSVSFIKSYRKLFPYFVLPQLFMLFYAIYLRIAQYDLTMNRYFVVIFGIWLLLVSLYLIISKEKQISYIPVILALFIILISVGPWGIYTLPESRQLNRLEANLSKAGILVNGNIIPLKKYDDIKPELSKEIYEGISYLCSYDQCKEIKRLFPKQIENLKKNQDPTIKVNSYNNDFSSWEIISGITQDIKVRAYSKTTSSYLNDETVYMNLDTTKQYPRDIKGFSKMLNITTYKDSNSKDVALIDVAKESMEILENGKTVDRVILKEMIEKLTKLTYLENIDKNLNREDMTFDLKGEKGDYRIFLNYIYIKNPRYTKKIVNENYSNVGGVVLIK